MDTHSFSFFPFGFLFCLTLLCFVGVRLFAIYYRYKDYNRPNREVISILKMRMAEGEIDEEEFQRLKGLLTK